MANRDDNANVKRADDHSEGDSRPAQAQGWRSSRNLDRGRAYRHDAFPTRFGRFVYDLATTAASGIARRNRSGDPCAKDPATPLIGLDTNVVVRLLVGDDEAQRATARTYIERHASASDPAFINQIVVIETVWVLESVYTYTRKQISAAIDGLLRTIHLAIENSEHVRAALAMYRGGADFADAMIAKTNIVKGCAKTATFDRKAAKRESHFVALAS